MSTKTPEKPKDKETKKAAPKANAPAKTAKAKAGDESAAAAKAARPKTKSPAPARRPLISGTYLSKWNEYQPKWKLIDARGQTLGRLSSHVAMLLMGKDKPQYTRSADTGDFVVVINAKEVRLTGNKWAQKSYKYHTNFPGGLKETTAEEMRDKHPERVIERAVWGMLPKGHMGTRWFKKLRVFAGEEHPHKAQQPQKVELTNLGMNKAVM